MIKSKEGVSMDKLTLMQLVTYKSQLETAIYFNEFHGIFKRNLHELWLDVYVELNKRGL